MSAVTAAAPRRCLVIGSGGAGKTTFARLLADRTGLPVVHLDALYWSSGWQPKPGEEWRDVVDELVRRPRWIMDGNYGGTLDARLAAADTVYFLDTPRWICLTRVLRRWWRYRGVSRPSMPDGCPERITWGFLAWIWSYPRRRRPGILARLAELEGVRVRVLRTARERGDALREFEAGGDG